MENYNLWFVFKSRFIIFDLMNDKNGLDEFLWYGMGVLCLTVLEPLMPLEVAVLGEPSPTVVAVISFLLGVNS